MSTIAICFMLIGCGFASGCLATSSWHRNSPEREARREVRRIEKILDELEKNRD